jgi:hypothetical protein
MNRRSAGDTIAMIVGVLLVIALAVFFVIGAYQSGKQRGACDAVHGHLVKIDNNMRCLTDEQLHAIGK